MSKDSWCTHRRCTAMFSSISTLVCEVSGDAQELVVVSHVPSTFRTTEALPGSFLFRFPIFDDHLAAVSDSCQV